MTYTAGNFSTQVTHGTVRNQNGVMEPYETERFDGSATLRNESAHDVLIDDASLDVAVGSRPHDPCDEIPDSPCEHHPEMWSAPAELTLRDAQGAPLPVEGIEVKQGQSLRHQASFDVDEARAIRAEKRIHVQFQVTTTDGRSWREGHPVDLNGDDFQGCPLLEAE